MRETMQISQEGLERTGNEEGYREFPYNDGFGNETVGRGHLIKPGEDFSAGLAEDQAWALLKTDMAIAEEDVNREVTVPMTQGEFDALCDFVFNLGDRLKSSTLLQLLNAGKTAEAEDQLILWDYAGGKPNAALKARRVVEMNLWNQGAQG